MMKRMRIKNKILIAAIVICVQFFSALPKALADNMTAGIDIRQRFSANNTSGIVISTTFRYRLTAKDGAPADNNKDFYLTGNAETVMPLTFSDYGEYTYELRQIISQRLEGYTYDEKVYSVYIRIRPVADPVIVISDADGNKYDTITFTNSYTRPLPPSPYPKTGDRGVERYAVIMTFSALALLWPVFRLKKENEKE